MALTDLARVSCLNKSFSIMCCSYLRVPGSVHVLKLAVDAQSSGVSTGSAAMKRAPPTSGSLKGSASSFHVTQFGRFNAWLPAEYALRFTCK